MPIRDVIATGKRPVKIFTNDIEQQAREQLERLSNMEFIHHHVAAMPDVHAGRGATIGSVIPTKNAVIPAAVGVDLGCGMMAVKLNLSANDLPDNLHTIRGLIERNVPHGRTDNGGRNDRGAWGDTPEHVLKFWKKYGVESVIPHVLDRHPQILKGQVNTHRHLGTLGSGNHFIEVCLDEANQVWVMLHSGSRGIGNRIGSYFIEKAKQEMERWFINLPDADLAYLPEGSEYFQDYLDAVGWAQDYALANREIMMESTLKALEKALNRPLEVLDQAINCHHNYIEKENHYGANVWVTRKGAIRAREGDMGIIPGSMGAKSYIVRGLGNHESLCSCSHGAGRKMSRAEAKRRFTLEDVASQTQGIECDKSEGVLDEIPGAYKDIDVVMENQKDLAEVVHTLRQIVNVKGTNG